MRSLHCLVAFAALASAPLVVPACSSALGGGGGTATSACTASCDKEETCGDIDSVAASQCTNKCLANADVANAELNACINKSDILAAINQCLGRACSDYMSCLTTVPLCKTVGGTTTITGAGGSGTTTTTVTSGVTTSCDGTTSGIHVCETVQGPTAITCPMNTSQVSACSTTGLLGTCKVTMSGNTATEYFYSGGPINAATAQQACMQMNGTWTPG
jgi:hypothetical protein